jgi:hypothetical protein
MANALQPRNEDKHMTTALLIDDLRQIAAQLAR